jgi:hypothetical protein
MKTDFDKIDDAVLALLHLTSFSEHGISRPWKGHDWDALDRLHQKGFIADPKNKNKSIVFTEAGYKRASELFDKLFTS